MIRHIFHRKEKHMATASSFRSKFSSSNDVAKLQQKASELNNKAFEKDTRYWTQTLDKSGVGFSRIRFLPQVPNEELPWVRLWQHIFKGPSGLWYWENCPTTINKPCPCCEENSKLWATEDRALQAIVRNRKRKLNYVSNIIVLEDPLQPANEGKVFLFKYGKAIFDKINEKMNPTFKGDVAVNPFDFWEGCDLRLKAKKVDGFVNYDSSEWSSPNALSSNESQLEAIYNLQHPLLPLVAEDQFKSYEQLRDRLLSVIRQAGQGPATETYQPSENVSTVSNRNTEPEDAPFETTPERSSQVQNLIANPKTAPLPEAKKPAAGGGSNLARLKALAAAAEE